MASERGLKTWLHFQMFHYKRKLQKSRNENRKYFAKLTLRTFFTGGIKNLVKTWNKIFHCSPFKTSTFKASMEQVTKAALALWLGKFFFIRVIFRMDAQVHTQANLEMWRNFLSSHMHSIYRQAWYKFVLPKWCIISM